MALSLNPNSRERARSCGRWLAVVALCPRLSAFVRVCPRFFMPFSARSCGPCSAPPAFPGLAGSARVTCPSVGPVPVGGAPPQSASGPSAGIGIRYSMPCRSRPCIFAPQARLQAAPPGVAACARLARPISTSPNRQRCSYGAAAAWCHLDSSPRGDSTGCKCSPSQTCITLLRASRRPPDTPRTCRLGSGQLPIRETGSAVNKAPHTSASGPSAGIGTTLGLSCGSVL